MVQILETSRNRSNRINIINSNIINKSESETTIRNYTHWQSNSKKISNRNSDNDNFSNVNGIFNNIPNTNDSLNATVKLVAFPKIKNSSDYLPLSHSSSNIVQHAIIQQSHPLHQDLNSFSAPISRKQSDLKLLSSQQIQVIQTSEYKDNDNTRKNNLNLNINYANINDNLTNNNQISYSCKNVAKDNNSNYLKTSLQAECDNYEKNDDDYIHRNLKNNKFLKMSSTNNNNNIKNTMNDLALNEVEEPITGKINGNNSKNSNNNNQNSHNYNSSENNLHSEKLDKIPKNQKKKIFSNNNICMIDNGIFRTVSRKLENKSLSNPLLEYVMVGIKSSENIKAKCQEISKSQNNKGIVKDFNLFTSKQIFDTGLGLAMNNYKLLLTILVALGGAACIYMLYLKERNTLPYTIYEILKAFLSEEQISMLKKIFDTELYLQNIFPVCCISVVLIALVMLYLKFREYHRYKNFAKEDYKLVKNILQISRTRENNCDIIGFFENNIIIEGSKNHNITEEAYKANVFPLMNEIRLNESFIEEAEVLIQDQTQTVWRLKKF